NKLISATVNRFLIRFRRHTTRQKIPNQIKIKRESAFRLLVPNCLWNLQFSHFIFCPLNEEKMSLNHILIRNYRNVFKT
ncbi:hypothetical protein P3749_24620, partial [Vibrio parahaemolyticus]|uniref:hypothetical protein n=1 Tax=Vibrio parahaemolyticus TaxID=670 RepID=UPI001BAEBE59